MRRRGEGLSGGEKDKGVRINREGRANMLEEERTAETGSVFYDRDDVAF